MATKTNAEIAAAFEELGDLYELDGAVSYRVIAYRTAAKAVRDASVSIMALTREGKVTTVPGIGKTLEEKLKALDETGDIPSAVKLRAKFPAGLISIMHLPGFGAKRAQAALRRARRRLAGGAARGGRGGRDPQDPRASARRSRRTCCACWPSTRRAAAPRRGSCSSRALPVAEQIAGALRDHPAADRVEIAGSLRRLGDTAKDIDIIATASDAGGADLDRWPSCRWSSPSPRAATAGARVVTHSGMKVDLRVVAPDQFGNVLQHFTGAKAHNVQLREAAVRRGLHVSEYGILDDETGETLRCATEEEVYERLGYAWIPPELREGRGELEAAAKGTLPALITLERPARRPALPHDALRRAPDARADGRGGAGARLGVPRGHRPLRLARVRRPRHARGAGGADRRGRGAQRAAGRHHDPRRHRVQHPPGRLARTTRTSCCSGWTG